MQKHADVESRREKHTRVCVSASARADASRIYAFTSAHRGHASVDGADSSSGVGSTQSVLHSGWRSTCMLTTHYTLTCDGRPSAKINGQNVAHVNWVHAEHVKRLLLVAQFNRD